MTIGPLSSPDATMRLIARPNCARSPNPSQHTRAGRPSHGRYFCARRIHRASVSSRGNSRRTTLSVLMMSSGFPVTATHRNGPRPSAKRGRMKSGTRSEEHTSELQSPYDLVCRLLLEKKKKKTIQSLFSKKKKIKKKKK